VLQNRVNNPIALRHLGLDGLTVSRPGRVVAQHAVHMRLHKIINPHGVDGPKLVAVAMHTSDHNVGRVVVRVELVLQLLLVKEYAIPRLKGDEAVRGVVGSLGAQVCLLLYPVDVVLPLAHQRHVVVDTAEKIVRLAHARRQLGRWLAPEEGGERRTPNGGVERRVEVPLHCGHVLAPVRKALADSGSQRLEDGAVGALCDALPFRVVGRADGVFHALRGDEGGHTLVVEVGAPVGADLIGEAVRVEDVVLKRVHNDSAFCALQGSSSE